MTDAGFIEKMLEKGLQGKNRVEEYFLPLSPQQLDWAPAEDVWSITDCLEHLIVSDRLLFPPLKQIANGEYRMTAWQRWSPLSPAFGSIMRNYLSVKVHRRIKCPENFLPPGEIPPERIIASYLEHLEEMMDMFGKYTEVDLDRIRLTSRISGFVTYSLRDALLILVQHTHRHINQALHVTRLLQFPKS